MKAILGVGLRVGERIKVRNKAIPWEIKDRTIRSEELMHSSLR